MSWLQTTSRETIMPFAKTDDEQKAQQMLSASASACFWFSCCCLLSSWFIFWFLRSFFFFFFRQWFAVSVRPNLVKSSLPILGSQERETRQNLDRERLMKTKLCLERRVDPLPTRLPSRSVVFVTKKFISRLLSIVRVNHLCLQISLRQRLIICLIFFFSDCAYKKSICSMCGKKLMSTAKYNQSSV